MCNEIMRRQWRNVVIEFWQLCNQIYRFLRWHAIIRADRIRIVIFCRRSILNERTHYTHVPCTFRANESVTSYIAQIHRKLRMFGEQLIQTLKTPKISQASMTVHLHLFSSCFDFATLHHHPSAPPPPSSLGIRTYFHLTICRAGG